MDQDNKKECFCSFCGKPKSVVGRMLVGIDAYICEDCVFNCNYIVTKQRESERAVKYPPMPEKKREILTPKQIYDKLSEYVIGQEKAKKKLSVAVYNHYKRIDLIKDNSVEIQKSNILMLGPTGSGKTLLAQTLAKLIDVPFAIADATALTEAGYVGEDVENILVKLIQAADGDVEKAQRGIVYIDEIDKIGRKGDSASLTRDVSGEGVQQALLKIIEGCVASVPPEGGRKNPHEKFIPFDTTNVLFICGGAFDGMDRLIQSRTSERNLGFNADIVSPNKTDPRIMDKLQQEDLLKFGLIPEFIGRLPVVTVLDELSEDALARILQEPRNAIYKQYKKLLEVDNVELEFEDEATSRIVEKSKEKNLGARGLRSILEQCMNDIMFDVPSHKDITKIIITADTIDGKEPIIIRSEKSEESEKNKEAEDNKTN